MPRRGYRSHRHRHAHRVVIPIPATTAQTIIFTFGEKTGQFDTSEYQSFMTQDRASIEEIQQYLSEIEAPLTEWKKKYGKLASGTGIYAVLIFMFMCIAPLLIIYICWLSCAQAKAQTHLKKASEKSKEIMKEKQAYFAQKGLTWVTPVHFPRWIELWTGVVPVNVFPNPVQTMMMPQQQMMMMPQQPGLQQPGFQQPGLQQAGFQQPGVQPMSGYDSYRPNDPNMAQGQNISMQGGYMQVPNQQGDFTANQYSTSMYGPNNNMNA